MIQVDLTYLREHLKKNLLSRFKIRSNCRNLLFCALTYFIWMFVTLISYKISPICLQMKKDFLLLQ